MGRGSGLQHTQHNTGLVSLRASTIMELAVNMATEAQTVNIQTGLRFLIAHWFWVNGGDVGCKAWSVEGELQCPAMNQSFGQRREGLEPPKLSGEKICFVPLDASTYCVIVDVQEANRMLGG